MDGRHVRAAVASTMSSPAKRRRKDDHQAPRKAVRSLDYFFGKVGGSAAPPVAEAIADARVASFDQCTVGEHQAGNAESTDEELARRLQHEWNNQVDSAAGNEEAAVNNQAEQLPLDHTAAHALIAHSDHEAPAEARRSMEQSHSEVKLQGIAESGLGPFAHTLALQSAATGEDTFCLGLPLDESLLQFDTGKYLPRLRQVWALDDGHGTYALLTRCFVLASGTQSRLKIMDILVNTLRLIIEGDSQSLLPAIWLATNSISPPYVDLELGLGGSAISKALRKVCGLDNAGLKSLYNKYGDAGDVAFEAKKRQSFTLRKPKPLTIKGVYESLVKIARSKGTGSQEVKQRIVERLVQDARGPEESRYVVRTLVQHLRIGAVKTTALIALSRAFLLSRPPGASFPVHAQSDLQKLKKENLADIYIKSEEVVKACYARRPNYDDLVPALLDVGICESLLTRCGLALHIPLRPMLGSITRDLSEMLTKLQGRDFSCEYKYDGQRAQVHCDEAGKVTIFSRHLEVMTEKYPDLVALVPQIRSGGVSSFILEGEVVAIDRDSGELKTFQTLANRARKDVVIGDVKIDVCLFAFDLMFLNSEELLDRSFRERRELLRSLFVEIPHHFTWVKCLDATSADSEAVLDFFKSATDMKCEGIMVKVLDNLPKPELEQIHLGSSVTGSETGRRAQTKPAKSLKPKSRNADDPEVREKGGRRKALLATYEPDKRLDSWLKVKKDYNQAADTIDLIPVAGWHGQGRKAKWWSPILLAVRNPETGCLDAVTKCISGFTDKFYSANKEKYAPGSDNIISKPGYIEYNGTPDVWFEPQEVWEMAFADITLSPTYTAAIGLVSEDRGLSLRFPRFLRVRDDKTLEEASDCHFLAALWRKQEAKAPDMGAQISIQEDDEMG